jgi:hypothetical protein
MQPGERLAIARYTQQPGAAQFGGQANIENITNSVIY